MLTGGVWLENAADAARAYPEIVGSAQAVMNDRARRSVSNAYKNLLISKCNTPPLQEPAREVFYRRAAAGCKTTRAIFLAGPAAADPRQWLEDRLGPLAEFREESP